MPRADRDPGFARSRPNGDGSLTVEDEMHQRNDLLATLSERRDQSIRPNGRSIDREGNRFLFPRSKLKRGAIEPMAKNRPGPSVVRSFLRAKSPCSKFQN